MATYTYEHLDLSCEDLCAQALAYGYYPERFYVLRDGRWDEISKVMHWLLRFSRNVKLMKTDAQFKRL